MLGCEPEDFFFPPSFGEITPSEESSETYTSAKGDSRSRRSPSPPISVGTAALDLGRRFYLIERERKYIDRFLEVERARF